MTSLQQPGVGEPVGPADGGRSLKLLSVVAPVYNEVATVEQFYARVCTALEGLQFEIVLVDDGSTDGSDAELEKLAGTDPRVRVVQLSRNFGHQTALTAGLDHARGDAVVMLDADLQDPPELIPRMLDHWRAGCDVIYAVREQREGESRFKLTTARWFYSLFDRLAQVELQHNSGDFRMLDRRALDALLSMRERNRFLRGMTVWVGYRQAAVPYTRDARYAGVTKYTLPKMLRFSLDAISSFSHRPLQLATLLGFVISTLAFIAIPLVILLRILGSYLPGFSSLTIAVLLLGGIQLIAIGIIGEYVGRIYDEVKGRPLYLVRSRVNIPDDEAPQEVHPTDGPPRARRAGSDAALTAGRVGADRAIDPRGGVRAVVAVGPLVPPGGLLEGRDPARQALDRVRDRVGQVHPVGVRALGPAPLDADRMAGVADHR